MKDNIDVILNNCNTLIIQEEDAIYFISKGDFGHYSANITKVSASWCDPTLEDLDDKLKEALNQSGLTEEEIEEEIEEFHQTDFYNQAKEYLREDESEEDENNNFEKPWDYGRHFIDLEEELGLPTEETFELENFEGYKDNDELKELILDFLSGKYSCLVKSFSYKINERQTHITVKDIEWDTTE